LHRFRDIAFDMSNMDIFGYSSCILPQTDGFPWDDLRKMLQEGPRITRVQNGVKTLWKFSNR